MNRRNFFSKFGLLIGAATVPTIFIPKINIVHWHRPIRNVTAARSVEDILIEMMVKDIQREIDEEIISAISNSYFYVHRSIHLSTNSSDDLSQHQGQHHFERMQYV
jgi:hypothetical protein